jgi:predicted GNAT family acetyltransferase
MEPQLTLNPDLVTIDWARLKADLLADDFDNGRTAAQLLESFQNSAFGVFAIEDGRVVGTARLLSDGVCNAYLVDVWTHSEWRGRGIASRMVDLLIKAVPGQHIYLQADDDVKPFYTRLGFEAQPHGLCIVSGQWLQHAGNDGA